MITKNDSEDCIFIEDNEFYNEVMALNNYISTAKEQVIRKLYKNMAIYKHKGAECWENKRENLLKSRAFYEEILVLKKFDKFEIIKLLFLVSRSLEEVLNDSTSSIEERVFCRLAENKLLNIALKQCKSRYPDVANATLKEFKMLCRKLQMLRKNSPSIINTHSTSFTQRRYMLICAYRLLGGGKKYQSLMKMANDLEKKESECSTKVEKSVVSTEVTSKNQQEVGSRKLKRNQHDQNAPKKKASKKKRAKKKKTRESFFKVNDEKLAKASLEATRLAAKEAMRSIAKRNIFNRVAPSTASASNFFSDWDLSDQIIMEEPANETEMGDQALKNDSLFYDRSKYKAEVQKLLRKERFRKAEAYRRLHNIPPPWAKPVDTTTANANREPIQKHKHVPPQQPSGSELLKPQYLKQSSEGQ